MKPYIQIIFQINKLAATSFSQSGRFKPSQFAINVIDLLACDASIIYIEDIKAAYQEAMASTDVPNQPKWESVLTAIKTDGGMCARARRSVVIDNDRLISK